MGNMKKLFGLLLALVLVLQMVIIPVSASRDPYSITLATSFDEMNDQNPGNAPIAVLANRVGTINVGDWLCFKGMDFGALGPASVDFTNTSPQGAKSVVIRLDGPSGEVLVDIPLTFSTGWGEPMVCSAPITKKITGVHDIYVSTSTSTLGFSDFAFVEKASNVVETNYSLYSKTAAFSDLEGEDCAMAVNNLYGLGIIPGEEDGIYDPLKAATRGEFAYSIYRIFVPKVGEEEAKAVETAFTDVASDYKYAEAINYVSQNGIVNGVTETEFDPYAYITYQDALTIILRALGYKDIAEAAGGYPTGYISTAAKAKITISGVAYDECIRRGQMALLLENVLDADYMTADSVKNGELQLKKEEGILGLTQNLYFDSGIVRATDISVINMPADGKDKGYVSIGDDVYHVGKVNVLGLLGYECDFWYEDKDGEKTIKSIIPCASTKYFDITSANDEIFSITDSEIKYQLKGETKEKEIEIDSNTSVLYNGVALEGRLSEVVDNPTAFKGTIRVVENGDGSQVLYVEEYNDYIVESIDAFTPALKGVGMSEDDKISLDSTKNNVSIFDAASKKMKADKLEVGDIVTVYTSKNESGVKLVRVYLSEKSVSGAVTKIMDGKVYIGGQGYRMSNNYSGTIQGAQSGIFSLNIYDELVAFNISPETSAQIGLFLDYATSDIAFDRNVKIKFVDNKGAVKIYPVADKVTYNGRKFDNPGDILSNITVGENVCKGISNITLDEAFRYKLNTDGEISMLDTCDTLDGGMNDTMMKLTNTEVAMKYIKASSMLAASGVMKYYMENTGLVYAYYRDIEEKENFWATGQAGTLMPTDSTQVSCLVYSSIGSAREADVVVFSRTIAGGREFGEPILVESVSSGVDEYGSATTIITGVCGPGKLTYTVSDATVPFNAERELLESVKKGDIIRLKIVNNLIFDAEYIMFCDGAEKRNVAGNDISATINKVGKNVYSGGIEVKARYIYGTVEEKEDKYIVVKTGQETDGTAIVEMIPMPTKATLYYKRSDGEVVVAGGKTVSSIALGDKITVLIYNGKTSQVIINELD